MKYFVKFVILAIFAIFVAQSLHIARKILVTFAIFAIFGDISGPFLDSFCFQVWNFVTFVIFAIFAIFVMGVFS